MRRISLVSSRSVAVALALVLAACSSESPQDGAGGSGGGGTGGSGGSVEECDRPVVQGIEPASGYAGLRVKVLGRCFAPGEKNNRVSFNDSAAPIYKVSADGTEIETQVPGGAKTGIVAVFSDYGSGFVRTNGPTFTVTDEVPPPVLNGLSPEIATAGSDAMKVTLSGSGFVARSRVLLDGEEVASTYASPTSIQVSLSAEMIAAERTMRFRVVNDEPGGGASLDSLFSVVKAINVISAQATASNRIVVIFDQPVGGGFSSSRGWAVRYGSTTLRINEVDRVNGQPTRVQLSVANQTPDRTYTVTAPSGMTSSAGGAIRERSTTFRSFGSRPVVVDSFGVDGCGPAAISTPVGLAAHESTLYVTEMTGQQVQLVDTEGTFGGFLGHDGTNSGLHVDALSTALDCPAGGDSERAGAFLFPRGVVAVDSSGNRYVADTGNDRILAFDAAGAYVNEVGTVAWQSPVILGMVDGRLWVANGDDKIHRVTFSGAAADPLYGPGVGAGQFAFGLTDDGIPAMAAIRDEKFVTDPANHRVQRFKGQTATGWIGKGQGAFVMTGGECLAEGTCAGTESGEFTWPSGIAADKDDSIWVIDAANGGRVQRFHRDGNLLLTMNLSYMPGGIAFDEDGFLWIADQTTNRLHKYSL